MSKNPEQKPKSPLSTDLGLLLVRAPLGAFFAIVGYSFITDDVGAFVARNLGVVSAYLPDNVGRPILYALPFMGIMVGLMIVVGFFTRMAGLLASAILVGVIGATTGIFSAPPQPFHPSVLLLSTALLLLLAGGGGLSLDGTLGKRKPAPAKE